MSMIRVDNLRFAYPANYENVLENVSLQIDTDWKLGFIGKNGREKTTFLNLLLGKYEYKGKIHTSVQFDYSLIRLKIKEESLAQYLEAAEKVYPNRPRKKYCGKLIQMDASVYRCFGGADS